MIDVKNPLLTSFNPDRKTCPFHSSIDTRDTQDLEKSQSRDEKTYNNTKSVDYYLQLAEEVDQWLLSEETDL